MNCAYCKEGLNPSGDLRCARCGTVVHEECAELDGECLTLGCGAARFVPHRAVAGLRLRPDLTEHHARQELRRLLEVLIAPREEVSLLVLGLLGLVGLTLLI